MATSPNSTQITPPRVSIIDERTGAVSREWYRWFYSLYNIVGTGTGVIPVASGGTGLSTIPTNGQLLIGNGTGYTLNTLGFGTGISIPMVLAPLRLPIPCQTKLFRLLAQALRWLRVLTPTSP